MELLIRSGADVDARHSETGSTPLQYAVITNHKPAVELLLKNGANVRARYRTGAAALHLAANRGYLEIAGLLLARGAAADDTDLNGNTALFEAAWKGHTAMVALLLDKGASANAISFHTGSTPLHEAAAKGHSEVVEMLLARGANPEAKDKNGATPLDEALRYRHAKAVAAFPRKAGDANQAGSRQLKDAVLRGQADMAGLLLDRGVDPNAGFLLHDAALKGFVAIAKLLISHGADVNRVNADGSTPLHDAALAGHAEIIELLLSKGAEINALDGEQSATPLHHASSWGRPDAVNILLKHGADPDIPNKSGVSPLQAAQTNGRPDIVAILKKTPSANNRSVTVTKLADTADWLGRGLEKQVQEFSLKLSPRLARLERKFESSLKREGFDGPRRQTLSQISPLAAARHLLDQQDLTVFFQKVEVAGRDLARFNVSPNDVTRALQLCDLAIDSAGPDSGFQRAREQLTFCTILALNHAYYEVRETESRAFYELFHIEVESSNIDVLFRKLVEAMANWCGAAAGHIFLLNSGTSQWQLIASTANAGTSDTVAVFPATAPVRRSLLAARKVTRPELLLDAGWKSAYKCVWSAPLGDGGAMQFAFPEVRDLLPRELELLSAAGDRCLAAARKTRLLEDIAKRERQLSELAIRMLMVEENERRRISHALHDDAGQSLVVIRLQMEMIEMSLPPGSEVRERLAEARDITEKTILDLRRLIGDLSPAVIDQLGLGAAVRQLVNRFRGRYPCNVNTNIGELPVLDANFQLVIYRLAQECFNNISQHSQATSVNVSITGADSVLRLRVEDNGTGFNVDEALQCKHCFGLKGIRERVAVLGGNVSISSTRKGVKKRGNRNKGGTVVDIELPIS